MFFIELSDGDARYLLNMVQLIVSHSEETKLDKAESFCLFL